MSDFVKLVDAYKKHLHNYGHAPLSSWALHSLLEMVNNSVVLQSFNKSNDKFDLMELFLNYDVSNDGRLDSAIWFLLNDDIFFEDVLEEWKECS